MPPTGHDLVIELSAARVRALLGAIVPRQVGLIVTIGGIKLPLRLYDGEVSSVAIRADNRLDVTVRYFYATLGSANLGLVTLAIAVDIVDDDRDPRGIALSYPLPPRITVGFPDELETLLAVAATGMTGEEAIVHIGDALVDRIRATGLPRIPLGQPTGGGPHDPTLADVRVRTIRGSLLILVSLTGPGIDHATPSDRGARISSDLGRDDAMITLAGDTLLGLATTAATAPPSLLAGAAFERYDDGRRLTRAAVIPVDGRRVSIDALAVGIEEGEFVITGALSYAGTGFRLGGTFRAPVAVSSRGGLPAIDFDPHRVETDIVIHIEWWVYLVSAFLVPVLGSLLGPVVAVLATVLVALAAPIASLLINAVSRGGLTGIGQSLAGSIDNQLTVLPQRLGRLVGEMRCTSVTLSDLRLSGTIHAPMLPALTVAQRDEVTNQVDLERHGLGPAAYTVAKVARRTTITAQPVRVVGPVSVQWTVDGAMIRGSGTRQVNGTPVTCQVTGPVLTIDTPVGTEVDIDVCAEATDGDGFVLNASIVVSVRPTELIYDAGTRYGIYRQLRDVLPRGLPSAVFDPLQPDPPPDALVRHDSRLGLAQAVANGMGLDPRKLATNARLAPPPPRQG